MNKNPEEGGLRPELRAGYVDGELDARTRAAMDAHLLGDARAADDVAGQRRLLGLYQDNAALDPGEAAWAGVLDRMKTALDERPATVFRRKRWPYWAAAVIGLVGFSAVVWAMLQLATTRSNLPLPLPPVVEVLPVASPRDIEILSMEFDDDAQLLVVGRAPLPGPMALASADDVSLERVDPDTDGMVPKHVSAWPFAPMIVTPLGPGPEEDP